VRKGYLRRVGDKQDRRVHRLMLTEQGEEILRSDPLQQLSRALESLTQEERWSLAVSMEKVLRQLIHV
jgi:DNA-binding MarR family transcriptional regulator